VFGIFTSRAMRERGRYQLQLMKTRSSSGVGMKIDLEFNIETLKITDLPEDEQDHGGSAVRGSSSIIESIKNRSTVSAKADEDGVIPDPKQGISLGKVRATVESTKLRQILNSMGTDETY
jgi:hypothetical protein